MARSLGRSQPPAAVAVVGQGLGDRGCQARRKVLGQLIQLRFGSVNEATASAHRARWLACRGSAIVRKIGANGPTARSSSSRQTSTCTPRPSRRSWSSRQRASERSAPSRERCGRAVRQHNQDAREHAVAVGPRRDGIVLVARRDRVAMEPDVAAELGREVVHGHGGAIKFYESMVEADLLVGVVLVGQEGIGDELFGSLLSGQVADWVRDLGVATTTGRRRRRARVRRGRTRYRCR